MHALFRFLDITCAGAVPVEEFSDAVYGPMRPAQLGLVQAAFEARPPAHAWRGLPLHHTHALLHSVAAPARRCVRESAFGRSLGGWKRAGSRWKARSARVQAIRGALGGSMDVSEALKLFDCKTHPDHLGGARSKAALIGDFVDAIGGNELTWPEFQRYYRAVAACVSPEDFEQMVRALRRACCHRAFIHRVRAVSGSRGVSG